MDRLRRIMARLRSPGGCPWDLEQTHHSLRMHAIEEVYELIDAIEQEDDGEMVEELGDLLLQVVFHCQLAQERGAFDFDTVASNISDKLIRRHPHVFGKATVRDVAGVWAQWELIKKSEKAGTRHARHSALDGIPKHLPALMRAQKLLKKAEKAGLSNGVEGGRRIFRSAISRQLFELAARAHKQGWNAEELLQREILRREKAFRKLETGKRGDSARPRQSRRSSKRGPKSVSSSRDGAGRD